MPTTSTEVSFGLYALAIKPDGTPSSASDLQTFSNLDDLRTGNVSGHPYASYEPDFWLLNGGYKFMPDDADLIHVGLMSLDQSDVNGDFATPPVLTIDFTEAHTSDGLVLHFSRYTGDYANSIMVQWNTLGGALIRQDIYAPDSADYTIDEAVSNFGQIVITFFSTSRPYRYLRVMGIDYGYLITFTGADIKSAHVVEDTDPIGAELRSDSLEIALYSSDATFNPLNPSGYYEALKERQPLIVYEIVDNAPIFIGQYFLDEWQNTGDTEIAFRCVDLIGLMEELTTRGGLWESPGIALEDLLEDLLTSAAIPYELDPALVGTAIIGWLPAGTLRAALQQIAFAVGASVDCSRSWAVKIVPSPMASGASMATITRAQKGIEQSLTLRPLVTSVEVVAHNYSEGTDSLDLFDGTLAAGTHEILFDEPAHTLNIAGATITESGANYAIIEVATPGTVTLTGSAYVDSQMIYQVVNESAAGSIRPGLSIDKATLVHGGNVATVAYRVYDYHQQRYQQAVKLFAPLVEVGQVVTVDALYGQHIRGVIESMSINLAGGMIAQVEIVGVAL